MRLFRAHPVRAASSGLVTLLCVSALGSSCAESGPESGDDGTDIPVGGETAGAGATAAKGATGGSASPSSGGSLSIELGGERSLGEPGGVAGESASVSPSDACATSTVAVAARPSILQLVIDTSGSMDWPPGWEPKSPDDSKPPGATKWEITREALLKAVAALPADVALGVSFYPNVEQADATCLLSQVAVPIAPLAEPGSMARLSFETAMNDVVPIGATPTHGAYRFGLMQLANTSLRGNEFLLLIIDGIPTCTIDCACTENNEPVDSQPLLDEAAAAFSDGISTFVIGSPGSEAARPVLSRLAGEGGTAKSGCSDSGPDYCHFDMTTEPDLATGLGDALDEISMRLRSCEYPIPAPPSGQKLDPRRVNVLYTPSDGDTETVARDPTAGACKAGWQYAPDGTSIVLCGSACDRVRSDPASTVQILFGCQTVTGKPK